MSIVYSSFVHRKLFVFKPNSVHPQVFWHKRFTSNHSFQEPAENSVLPNFGMILKFIQNQKIITPKATCRHQGRHKSFWPVQLCWTIQGHGDLKNNSGWPNLGETFSKIPLGNHTPDSHPVHNMVLSLGNSRRLETQISGGWSWGCSPRGILVRSLRRQFF